MGRVVCEVEAWRPMRTSFNLSEVEPKKEDQHLAADTPKEEAAEKRLAEETFSPRKGARAL